MPRVRHPIRKNTNKMNNNEIFIQIKILRDPLINLANHRGAMEGRL